MSKAADAFKTISEVADELDVQKHVLRFWEVKFPQIRPMKRGGGRRYYRPEDLVLLRGIQHLLHAEGYTIKGVQKILREQGIEQVKVQGVAATARAESRGKAPAATQPSPPSTAKAARPAIAGRVRALPKSAKAPEPADEIPAVSSRHRAVIESALVALRVCRDVLVAPALTAVVRASAPTSQPRARSARPSR